MQSYTWTLDREAGRVFHELSESERRTLLHDFESLSAHPFREGHLRYREKEGREVRVWLIDGLDIHYQLDHAVRLARILKIEHTETPID